MQVNTMQRYDHTVDYYDFRIVQDGVGNTLEYFYSHKLPCRIFSDATGRLFMYVPEPVRMNARITNIRDEKGNLVVGAYQNDVGFSYDVTSVNPVLNAYGHRDALRYTLTRS